MDAAREQAFSLLRQQLQSWEHSFHGTSAARISSGCPDFDRFLPQAGFCAGQLVEWLGVRGSGVETLALLVARQAAEFQEAQAIVIIDVDRDFYPPAAMAWGIDLQRLIVVRPVGGSIQQPTNKNRSGKNRQQQAAMHPDLLWALDQSLRCPAVAAVWSRLPPIDPRDFRRLQLAAEEGNTLGILLRDPSLRGQPSWSDLQLLVTAHPGTGSFFGTQDAPSVQPSSPKYVPVPLSARPGSVELGTGSFFGTQDAPSEQPSSPKYVPVPLSPTGPTTSRRCCVQLVRSRHGAAGSSIELEIQESLRLIQAVPRTSPAESRSA